jgi:microcystin-dependent protein
MSFFKWSRTANNNATADPSINWAEGQAPSTVNDSARALMAAAAKYRDDVAGIIITGGTNSAYTLTSNQQFDSLANMDGKVIGFVPHVTNAAGVTLNVDGLGAKAITVTNAVGLEAGVLIAGTPYVAVYNNAQAQWRLFGFSPSEYDIPLAGGLPYFGTSAPNSKFAFPFGQAISRTTYAGLFGLISTTYGVGDGSTTFNLPDLRGRALFGKDDMGGSAANRVTSGGSGIGGNVLGAVGGAQNVTLGTAEMPVHAHGVTDPTHAHGVTDPTHAHGVTDPTHAHGVTDPTHAHTEQQLAGGGTQVQFGGTGGFNLSTGNTGAAATGIAINPAATGIAINAAGTGIAIGAAGTGIVINNAGGGNPHNNMPPAMMVNFILRVL